MSKGEGNATPENQELAGGADVQTILNNAATDPALSTGESEAVAPGEQPQVADNAADAKELLEFAHESLAPLYPRAAAIYTPDVRERLGVKIGALMDKYGLTVGGFLSEWGPELGLAITVIPLIGKTAQAVREDNAEWEAQQTAHGKNKTEAETAGGQTQIIDKPAEGSLYAKA